MSRSRLVACALAAMTIGIVASDPFAVFVTAQEAVTAAPSSGQAEREPVWPVFEVSPDWKQLAAKTPVWVDLKDKRVIVDGEVVLREGFLEMFACLRKTKEHEAIVAFPTKAQIVHAALLAVGAKPGKPVTFRPKYEPASGTEIDISVEWEDEEGKRQTAKAQDWILDLDTEKAMSHPFVFGGSGFWKDETTGKEHYMAESGDFICVANFPSAMIDLPIQSTQSNDALNFRAYTDRIPPEGTPIRMYLTPKLPASEKSADGP